MTDEPVNLDEHRGMAAQRDTEIRRDLHDVQTDQAALRGRQEELENFLDAAPAATRAEAARRARGTFCSCSPPPPRLRTPAGNGSSPARSTTSPALPSNRLVPPRAIGFKVIDREAGARPLAS